MLKLIIDQPGLLIQLPGIPPTRTPSEINLRCDLNVVISYLQSNGIKYFKLVSEEDPKKQKSTKTKEQIENNKQSKERETHSGIREQRFIHIEKMLEELLNKEPQIIEKTITKKSSNKIKKKILDDDDIQFIPSFKTNGMKIKGTNKTTEKSKVDLTDNIEKLRRLKGD